MKWLAKTSFLMCLLAMTHVASAVENQVEIFKGVDITAFKGRFARALRTVDQPFYMFHWRSSPDLVSSVEVQQDPRTAGHKIVQNEAPLFIPGLFAPKRTSNNMYGGGLYAAVDPVATEGYGSMSPDMYNVLVLHIPKGFRVLDLNYQAETSGSVAKYIFGQFLAKFSGEEFKMKATMETFQCNVSSTDPASILSSDISTTCAELVAHVLQSLQVDGFFYSYSATKFNICGKSDARASAMVFVSSRWLNMPGADARVYSSKTSADFEQRRVLESVFAYAKTVDKVQYDPYNLDYVELFLSRGAITPDVADKLRRSGGYSLNSEECKEGEDCLFKVSLLSYEWVDGQSIPSKPLTSELKLTRSDFVDKYMDRYPERFSEQKFYTNHWEDLKGQMTLADTEGWIKRNLYKCGNAESLVKIPGASPRGLNEAPREN